MAQDSGSYTASNPPVVDPKVSLAATASNDTTNAVITYTTTGAHNLVIGQPVITSGFSNAWLNYDPTSGTGAGTPAVVASVTGTNTFTVKTPAAFSTSSPSVSGTVFQQALVSNSPWDSTWLPTTAQTNVRVAREWGATNPIQPNKDATDGDLRVVGVATSNVTSNGTQVTFTVGTGHGLVAGQTVTIQGIAPNDYNFDTVQIASTGTTSIVFNSPLTKAVTNKVGTIVKQYAINGINTVAINAATGVVSSVSTSQTPTVAGAKGDVTFTVATAGVSVGMGVTATGLATGSVITAIGTGTLTVNPAAIGVVSSANAFTISTTRTINYRTATPHNLVSGQNVSVGSSSVAGFNVIDKPATVLDANTFSVPAPVFAISAISVGASSVTITTNAPHGFAVNDVINVSGVTGGTVTAINTASTTASAVTTYTITYTASSPALSGVTAYGSVAKNTGTFTGTAYITAADNGWSYTYAYPSSYLVPGLDNHDRVTNQDSGYPAYVPTYTTPTVTGLTTTNAIQKIRAAGLQPGNLTFTADLSVTAAVADGTGWKFTTGSTAHTLGVGDTVNLSGGTSGAVANNLGDATVAAVSGFTFTIANVTGTTTVTNLVARPKNTIVTAYAANSGNSLSVDLTRNYGL